MRHLNSFVGLIWLCVCSCGLPPNTNTSSTNPPLSPPKKPPRIVGAIPADIAAQTYTDSAGSAVPYDHKAQLEQLFALEAEGKELWLIIGRGNKETISGATGVAFVPLDDKGGTRVWVYGNNDASAVVKDNTPHLYMNFGTAEHLNTIPDGLFAGIAFDASVIKLIHNLSSTTTQNYYRMLRDKGLFFADLMLDGVIAWQTDAQKIMGCTNQHRKIYTTSTGREYCLSDWETDLIYSIGTSNATAAEKAEMDAKRIVLIKNYLGSIFGTGHCVAKNTGYPVPENTDDYLECTK